MRNASSSWLQDVSITASDARQTSHTRAVKSLGPGNALQLEVRTSDLLLTKVYWTSDGR